MKVLVADDSETNRRLISAIARCEGYKVDEVPDGLAAISYLQTLAEPVILVLDWEMPGATGIDVCQFLRQQPAGKLFIYTVMLTARDERQSRLEGLAAGADDYITKPFDREELLARLRIGARIIALNQTLSERVKELESALNSIKQLKKLLPMCSYCRKIRNDDNYWQQVESFLFAEIGTQVSHGICPDCYERELKPQIDKLDDLAVKKDAGPGERPR